MTHLEQRLAERGIHLNAEDILGMAALCDRDTAIILSRGKMQGPTSGDYYDRMPSNGEYVILIVRGRLPVTIMFRRANQPMRPDDLRVERVRDLTLGQRR